MSFKLDPHRTAGAMLCVLSAALTIAVFAWAIGAGSDKCPADLGATAIQGLDGRTVCVVRAR